MALEPKPIWKCPKCGFEEERGTFNIIVMFLITILCVMGGFFFLELYVVGPLQVASNFAAAQYTTSAREYSVELRTIALNHTTYDGSDSFEFAYDLMYNLPRIRYVPTNLFEGMDDPNYTFEWGGDCKHSAILFTSLMMSSGFQATVDCAKKHCVSIIPHRNSQESFDEYMVVDLTSDSIAIYDEGVDNWDDNTNPTEYYTYGKKWLEQQE